MGDKYTLRCKINNAKNEINDLNYRIRRMYDKKSAYEIDKRKAYSLKTRAEDIFVIKQNNTMVLQGVRGRANTTLVSKITEMFSAGELSKVNEKYDSIAEFIQKNINIAEQRIGEYSSRIKQLESSISNWESEIRDIERREEEERDARWKQLENIR